MQGVLIKEAKTLEVKTEIDPAVLIELFYSGQSLSMWVAGLVNPSQKPDLLSAPRSVFMVR